MHSISTATTTPCRDTFSFKQPSFDSQVEKLFFIYTLFSFIHITLQTGLIHFIVEKLISKNVFIIKQKNSKTMNPKLAGDSVMNN